MTLVQTLSDASPTTILFVALCLAAAVGVVVYLFQRARAARSQTLSVGAMQADCQTPSQDEIPAQLLAVLAAAAAAAAGHRVVIRRITFINRNTVSGWAEAGRASIQASHNLRRTI